MQIPPELWIRRFHDLRHTCASFLLASGADLRTVMAILYQCHDGIYMVAHLARHVVLTLALV
jgi:integrase